MYTLTNVRHQLVYDRVFFYFYFFCCNLAFIEHENQTVIGVLSIYYDESSINKNNGFPSEFRVKFSGLKKDFDMKFVQFENEEKNGKSDIYTVKNGHPFKYEFETNNVGFKIKYINYSLNNMKLKFII